MIQLDPWQEEALNYRGNLLLCTGRRVGKTYIMARKCIDRMAEKKGTKIVVVSLTEDQSQLIIAMALNYAAEKYPKLIGEERERPTQNKLYFNDGLMQARPVGQTGDAVRGFNSDILVIDEASRMPPAMWIASLPILTTSSNAEVWMCSTPFGKQGYFWEKFDEAVNKKDPDALFKVIYVSTETVMRDRPISESWTEQQKENAEKRLRAQKKEMSAIAWGQEYQGLFLEELRRYFSDVWIESVCKGKRSTTLNLTEKRYMGQDIARMGGDQSTWEIVKRLGDMIIHEENIVKSRILTTETTRTTLELNRIWRPRKIGLDVGSGSLGVGIWDFMMEIPEISHKLVAMNNRSVSLDRDGEKKQRIFKEEMYDLVRALGEQGKLVLLDDDEVKASLRSVQYSFEETKEEEEMKITNNTAQIKIFGNFTHIIEGIMRAVHLAYKDKSLNLFATYSNDGRR